MLHSRSLIAIADSNTDDIEKDFVKEPVFHSHGRSSADEAISGKAIDHTGPRSANGIEDCKPLFPTTTPPQVHKLCRTVSHEDFNLALKCVSRNAEALLKQLNDISDQTGSSSPHLYTDSRQNPTSTSTPRDFSMPSYLTQAISAAKHLTRNLKDALSRTSSPKLPKSLSEPPTSRSTPVPENESLLQSRKFSRSGSGGQPKLSKHSSVSSGVGVMTSLKMDTELIGANRQLSFKNSGKLVSAFHRA